MPEQHPQAPSVDPDFLQALMSGNAPSYKQKEDAPANEQAPIATTPPSSAPPPPTQEPDGQQAEKQAAPTIPATPTPSSPTTVANADFFAQLSNELGQPISDLESLKTVINRANAAASLESQLQQLQTENNDYKLKLQTGTFVDEVEAKRNELKRAGFDKKQLRIFDELQDVAVDTLQPKEAIKLAMQLRDGLTEKEAGIILNRRYKTDPDIDDLETIEESEIQMKLDARRDMEYLEKLKVQVSTPPQQQQGTASTGATPQQTTADQQREYDAYIAQATPIVQQLTQTLKVYPGVNINGKKDAEAVTLDLPIHTDFAKDVTPYVLDYAAQQRIPMTNEGVAHLKAYTENLAVLSNWQNWAIHIANETEKRLREEFHNPSPINRGAQKPAGEANQEYVDFLSQLAKGGR